MANNIYVNTNSVSPFQVQFIVENTSNKDLRIFNYPIPPGQTRNIADIPFVSENDIKTSLFKGELLNRLVSGEIRIVSSNINLQSFSSEFATFCNNNNIPHSADIAGDVSYIPANPGDWAPVPSNAKEALDTLAVAAGGGPGNVGKSFDAFSNQSYTLIATNFIDVTLGTNTITPGDIYTHTLGTSDVTVSVTGLYLIAYRASFDQTSSQRSISRGRIAINGTGLDYTITYGYHRNINTGEGTCAYTDVFSLNSGDVVKLQIARQDTTGGPIISIPESIGLSISLLRE